MTERLLLRSLNRRALIVLAVSVAIAGVGAVLRISCAGRACAQAASAASEVPFCRLPAETRIEVTNGFRDGRSPDVMMVARAPVAGGTAFPDGRAPMWPQVGSDPAELPIVLWGEPFTTPPNDPGVVTLDRIAPTVAEAIGLDRPHPEVRTGTAIEDMTTGREPRLVLQVVMTKIDSDDVASMPTLSRLASEGILLTGRAGTAPADPAALLTTIGTGGMPRQHGITGSVLRNDEGELVEAWGPGAPVSVIATLADDLDELNGQRPSIGLIAPDRSHRGLIGGNWYIERDRDDIVIAPARRAAVEADLLLRSGYGRGPTTDLMAVVLERSPARSDAALASLIAAGKRAAGKDLAVVVTGLGVAPEPNATKAAEVTEVAHEAANAEIVEAAAPGGLFLDQEMLAERAIPEDQVLGALATFEKDGARLFSDVFGTIAVSFARYC